MPELYSLTQGLLLSVPLRTSTCRTAFHPCCSCFLCLTAQKQEKTTMELKLQKLYFLILEDLYWRSPGGFWSKYVALWEIYPLLCPVGQDHPWFQKYALSPHLDPQTQKWKVAVFWLIDEIVWGLWNRSDRASFALSSSAVWTSTVLKLKEIQAKNCLFDHDF